jgi:hypothetical protein
MSALVLAIIVIARSEATWQSSALYIFSDRLLRYARNDSIFMLVYFSGYY